MCISSAYDDSSGIKIVSINHFVANTYLGVAVKMAMPAYSSFEDIEQPGPPKQ